MSTTVIPIGDPKAVTRFSAMLATQVLSTSYFSRKFVGKSVNNVIQQLDDLESEAGDTITYDLIAALKGAPVTGDRRLEGSEQNLRFHTDSVKIDQSRTAVSAGGRMSRKRTIHNLRMTAKDLLTEYFALWLDQLHFMYLSGARGVNQDFYQDLNYTGHAGNAFVPPDAAHIVYPGTVTSKASMTAADTMIRDLIEKVVAKASMLRAMNPELSNLIPVAMDGEDRFVMVMSKFQEFSLRTQVGASGWLDLQKAAAAAEGSKNRMFTGNSGTHIIFDPVAGPTHFWVYPGNSGTGQISAICARTPDDITLAPGADPDDMASYQTIELPLQTHWMAPVAVRNLLRAYRYSMEGVTTAKGDPIVDEVASGEVIKQALGFTPAKIAEAYEVNGRLYAREAQIESERRKIMERGAKMIMQGLPLDDATLAVIEDFNYRYPEVAIIPSSIQQSARSRALMLERSVGGANLNPKLSDRLREERAPTVYLPPR